MDPTASRQGLVVPGLALGAQYAQWPETRREHLLELQAWLKLTGLLVDALMVAVWQRGKPVALLHHSDQGSQCTSEHFQTLLKEQGITCSMSRAGEVWDNSAMESFFSSMKTERTAPKVYRTRGAGPSRRVRLHRAVLQPDAAAFDARLCQSRTVRGSSKKLKT